MSYPGYHQPDFLESIAKGLQVRDMVESIKAKREARAQQAELHRLAIEQHQQQNAQNSFKQTMFLQDAGFIPATPENEQSRAAVESFGGKPQPGYERPLVDTGRGMYRAPSRADKTKRAIEQQQIADVGEYGKARSTALGKAAGEAIADPNVGLTFPEAMGGKTVAVPKSKEADYWLKIDTAMEKKYPDYSISHADDGTGKRTYFGTNPKTGEVKTLRSIEGVAKPTGVSESSQNASAKLRAKTRVQQEYSGPHISQLTKDYASGLYQTYAQEEGINYDTEQAAKTGDPDALRQVNAVKARAQTEARRIVEKDLDKLEAQYTDEELANKKAAPAKSAAPKLKVGDVRTVRGKQMTITAVHPDGSFDAQ